MSDDTAWIWNRTVALPCAVVIAAPFATAAAAWLNYAMLGLGTGWSMTVAVVVFLAMTAGPYGGLLCCGARADRESARIAAEIAATPVNGAGDAEGATRFQ